jgi:hypothetical protein
MNRTYSRLGAKLDEDSYEWLLREHPEIAVAVEHEVAAGVDVESLRRFLLQHLGESRQGMINRCIGAARWLMTPQES